MATPPPVPPTPQENAREKSSTGLDANLAGVIAYALGFVTGIILLVLEKDSRFVRFHAWQSTIVFGAIFVINLVLGVIPILGWLISFLLIPVTLILWIILMVKAFQGEMFKLPIVGDIAQQQVR
ncbi:MAG: DUF4870 domain-containing protein [Vicinamibacteraceae bacterium]|nr:DUF4870 domain-containing protein [Vicinamibacteraceae bacterium]